MRARKRNERTLQAKAEVIRVIGEYLTAKEKKPSVKMPLRRQSYMRKYKISSNTYYRVLKMATDELGLPYLDYLEQANRSHDGHLAAENSMIRHVEPIDPTAVNDRFDSILQSISLLKKEISSAIGNDDEEKGI